MAFFSTSLMFAGLVAGYFFKADENRGAPNGSVFYFARSKLIWSDKFIVTAREKSK